MERALAQLVTTMQEITNECKEGDVTHLWTCHFTHESIGM
jgi:hypothetical protein